MSVRKTMLYERKIRSKERTLRMEEARNRALTRKLMCVEEPGVVIQLRADAHKRVTKPRRRFDSDKA